MLYFEAGCPFATVRSALPERSYAAQWFDPRTGGWIDGGMLKSDMIGAIKLQIPAGGEDWALKLMLATGEI